MSEFDDGIALEARPDDPTTFGAALGAGWQIGAGVNGGMLLAVVGNALGQVFARESHPDPVAVSAFYLTASRPGPASVHTEVLRSGRTMSTGQASLVQLGDDGRPVERMRVLATYGALDVLPDDVSTTATPPDLPPVEDCVGNDGAPGFGSQSSFLERLDLRLDPASAAWAVGEPSGRGLLQGWLRLADGREPDPLMLLLAADALPPVTFDLGAFGWAPTLELGVHLRARPAPGWLRVMHRTRNLAGGLFEEDAEVWDSAGRLVAQSRQLAKVPRPQQGES